jgi:threonine synthase
MRRIYHGPFSAIIAQAAFITLAGNMRMEQTEDTRPGADAGHGSDRRGELFYDAAVSNLDELTPELAKLQTIAADPAQPREDRLEAFEDIIDSEVGDTQLIRARNVERQVGFRQIYVKFEGGNPTGTQKDRIAFAQVLDALRRGYDTVTMATCGNYGAAMAMAAFLAGLRCVIYIPGRFQSRRLAEMSAYNAEIVRTDGDYEDAVDRSRRRAASEEWYDANPGSANESLQLRAYGEIAYEIYDELRDAPAAVAVPVSNGTTLAGIYKGFVSLYRRGRTSRIPRMVAGSSYRKNPVVKAFLRKLPLCEDLRPEQIRGTAINEPLINWQSIDGNLALHSLRVTDGWAGQASDKAMVAYARMIREKEGLSVLPAATAGLIALVEQHTRQPFPGDRYVAILTGRKA